MRSIVVIIISLLANAQIFAQQKTVVSGKVLDENDQPLQGVSIQILNKQIGTTTDKEGSFIIGITPKKATALVFSFTGYKQLQKNFLLSIGERETIIVKMERLTKQLQEVTVSDDRERRGEAGRVWLMPQKVW